MRRDVEVFRADLRRFSDVINERGDLLLQGVSQELLNEVQAGEQGGGQYGPGTPVRTGYARASWQAGVNEPGMTMLPPPGPGESPDALLAASQARNTAVLSRARLGDTVFLGNPVEYVEGLEYDGRSQQAPAGFVRIVLAAFGAIATDVATALRSPRSTAGDSR